MCTNQKPCTVHLLNVFLAQFQTASLCDTSISVVFQHKKQNKHLVYLSQFRLLQSCIFNVKNHNVIKVIIYSYIR